MKILLDTCVSPRTRDQLLSAGYEVVWTGDWTSDPGDEEILEAARRDSRILLDGQFPWSVPFLAS